jgi:hypothetical protein
VQLSSHPAALLEHGELLGIGVELRGDDRHPGVGGQHLDQPLVLRSEDPGARSREEQVAEHFTPVANGHAQEFDHLRVILRIPGKLRMPANVACSNRLAPRNQGAQYSVDARQGPDALGTLFGDANREETTESPTAVGNAECPVAGSDQACGRLEDLFEHPVEVEVAGYRQRGLIQCRKPARALR